MLVLLIEAGADRRRVCASPGSLLMRDGGHYRPNRPLWPSMTHSSVGSGIVAFPVVQIPDRSVLMALFAHSDCNVENARLQEDILFSQVVRQV